MIPSNFYLLKFLRFEILTNYAIRFYLPPWENEKFIFTFDDGPLPNTINILDLLEKYKKRTIFFMLGEQVKRYPEIAKEVFRRGHLIGSHGLSHIKMDKLCLPFESEMV